jgi:hypothetical protein
MAKERAERGAVGDEPSVRRARWERVIAATPTIQLRLGYLRFELAQLSASAAAATLDLACTDADAGSARARALVATFVQLLSEPSDGAMGRELRDAARAAGHRALERLLRRPFARTAPKTPKRETPAGPEEIALFVDADAETAAASRHVPDYGKGRPLTLGERKSMARRPPPHLMPKILQDPHPDVIRLLLGSPRVTEDDVVRLVARRPGRADVLAEVARHAKWSVRPRVRAALVLQPATPTEVAIAQLALLRRDELSTVMQSSAVHPAVRAAARERHERLPPVELARAPADDALQ